jgi:hypothetical protein
MVKSFLRPFRRWAAVDSLLHRFSAWPAEDFGRYVSHSIGTGMAGAFASISPPPVVEHVRPAAPAATMHPGTFEMRFMALHSQGRFEEMWEMLADDAQRAWGGLQNFIREMPRLDEWLEILEMQVANVTVLDTWTDHVHQVSYSNVARLVMRYKVRQNWKEWTFDRQVHLVPAAGGWRTLCYPTRTAIGR